MKKNCLKCNKEFLKKNTCSLKKWESSKYCSHSCANSVNANGYRLSDHIRQHGAWNKGKKFPSKQNLISLICMECKNQFFVRLYRKDTAHFCSHACAASYRDEGKRTEHKKIRESFAYKMWRTSVFERDNYQCVECGAMNGHGTTVDLNADHIKPFALFPELRLELSNGRTLCIDCHKKTGTWGRGALFRNSKLIPKEA